MSICLQILLHLRFSCGLRIGSMRFWVPNTLGLELSMFCIRIMSFRFSRGRQVALQISSSCSDSCGSADKAFFYESRAQLHTLVMLETIQEQDQEASLWSD